MPQPTIAPTYRIRICGEAGEGISTAGELLLNASLRSGLQAACVKYLPSNIRGGCAEALVTLCAVPSFSPIGACDMLVVVNPAAIAVIPESLDKHGMVLVVLQGRDSGSSEEAIERFVRKGFRTIPVPIAEINSAATIGAAAKVMAALGVIGSMLGIDISHFGEAISARFREKSHAEVEANRGMVAAAYAWAAQRIDTNAVPAILAPLPGEGSPGTRLILDGNEAVALGAIASGCSFYASYPITPATSVGETLARLLPEQGGCAYQAEDEMAALGAVIGASFAGAKALTATSGPGLSLMQEFIGYASMAEIPAVIVDVQRAGPSTGMPTRHGQDDLLAAAFGGHGEGPRMVIAPQSVEDCFTSTITAFNCAEQYQCPVILLSDASLGLMKKSVDRASLVCPEIVGRTIVTAPVDKSALYYRYRLSDSGISPVAVPGNSLVTCRITGVEHTEDGVPVATAQERMAQVEKRARKLRNIEAEFDGAVEWDLETEGDGGADIGVIAWGFTVAATREAVARLRREGRRIAALYPRLLYPLCKEAVGRWAQLCPVRIVVEANSTGQLCSLIGMETGIRPHSYAVSRGEPLAPDEIHDRILQLLRHSEKGGA
jgi:2-oxoglutarate ferredoxin oxidoreductase subunit alpha